MALNICCSVNRVQGTSNSVRSDTINRREKWKKTILYIRPALLNSDHRSLTISYPANFLSKASNGTKNDLFLDQYIPSMVREYYTDFYSYKSFVIVPPPDLTICSHYRPGATARDIFQNTLSQCIHHSCRMYRVIGKESFVGNGNFSKFKIVSLNPPILYRQECLLSYA